ERLQARAAGQAEVEQAQVEAGLRRALHRGAQVARGFHVRGSIERAHGHFEGLGHQGVIVDYEDAHGSGCLYSTDFHNSSQSRTSEARRGFCITTTGMLSGTFRSTALISPVTIAAGTSP